MRNNILLTILILLLVSGISLGTQYNNIGCEISQNEGYVRAECIFPITYDTYVFNWSWSDEVESKNCKINNESQWNVELNDKDMSVIYTTEINMLDTMHCIYNQKIINASLTLEISENHQKDTKYMYRLLLITDQNKMQYRFSSVWDNLNVYFYNANDGEQQDNSYNMMYSLTGNISNDYVLVRVQLEYDDLTDYFSVVSEKGSNWYGFSESVDKTKQTLDTKYIPIKITLKDKVDDNYLKMIHTKLKIEKIPIYIFATKVLGFKGFPFANSCNKTNELLTVNEPIHIQLYTNNMVKMHLTTMNRENLHTDIPMISIRDLAIRRLYIRNLEPYRHDSTKYKEWTLIDQNVPVDKTFDTNVMKNDDFSTMSIVLAIPQLSRRETNFTLYMDLTYNDDRIDNNVQFRSVRKSTLISRNFTMRGCMSNQIYHPNLMLCVDTKMTELYYFFIIFGGFFTAAIVIRYLKKIEFRRYIR